MPLNLLSFLDRHLHSSKVINGKYLKYSLNELHDLCSLSIDVFANEPPLVRLNPPCVIVGDIHGQFYDLIRMFSAYSVKGTTGSLAIKYVFLGDYVDRGRHSLECLCVVLALKAQFPSKYQVLRGNHECVAINRVYGFFDELVDRFGTEEGERLWEHFNDVFSWMPLAGLIGSKILCMHGGISPVLKSLADIENIPRPLTDAASCPLALDLLWADPMENLSGFRANSVRGVSVFFGADEVAKCCKALKLQLIVRGHQMMTTGFGMFADKKLMTVFTAPRYQADNPNNGATLHVDGGGRIGINILRASDGTDTDRMDDKSDSGSCYYNREEEGAKRKRTPRKATSSSGGTKKGSKK